MNGFIVMNEGGVPIYSITADMHIELDTILLSGFLSAIQSFAHELDTTRDSYIREMKMQSFNLMYRSIEKQIFIGITDSKSNYKLAETVLEFLIYTFLSMYREILLTQETPDINQFNSFDDVFNSFRGLKEKQLKKSFEKSTMNSTLLQGVLNRLINYFPIKEMIKLNPTKLIIIGKTLIWVDFTISEEEEKRILDELREKTGDIYGASTFDDIVKKVTSDLENIRLFRKS